MRYQIEKGNEKVVISEDTGFWPISGEVGFVDSQKPPIIYDGCNGQLCDVVGHKISVPGLPKEGQQYLLILSSKAVFPEHFYTRGTKIPPENVLKVENGFALRLEVGQRVNFVWNLTETSEITHEANVRVLR